MSASSPKPSAQATNPTTTTRTSDRELVVTRSINGPARLVFAAWTTPELLMQWWVPKSIEGMAFVSCEVDARVGGRYRFVFSHPAFDQPMPFFGRYLEVVPHTRLVWTNEEGGDNGTVTTVTFEEVGNTTMVVVHDLYSSKEALDEAIASGSTGGLSETFGQLEDLLGTLPAA